MNAWNFGDGTQIPALQYADYDGEDGNVFDCDPARSHFHGELRHRRCHWQGRRPAAAAADCNDGDETFTLLPGQDEASVDLASPVLQPRETVMLAAGPPRFGRIDEFASFSWRQLAGPRVALMNADSRVATFEAPESRDLMEFELTAIDSDGRRYRARIILGVDVDRDDNGLIEIDSLLELYNMRHNLAGTSYKASATSEGNSFGCPDTGCEGYELMQDLDFDVDGDGTWSDNGDEGYALDSNDSNVDYFLVDNNGAGGWLPIGDESKPFAAVFDGNGHRISNLAIRRDQIHVGLFGAIGAKAAIRGLGLIDNLADYTGNDNEFRYIGGLVGLQSGGSITASYATGPADGGTGFDDYVGGLVGRQFEGSITASHATGAAAGGGGGLDQVGGLVGQQLDGSITASYATGPADGGDGGGGYVGGLVGGQARGSITASYATGAASGGDGDEDLVGGLVGRQAGGSITASYATGAAAGGDGDKDSVGALVGLKEGGSIAESYGFGELDKEDTAAVGRHPTLTLAVQLSKYNAGAAWNDAVRNTWGAWNFGDETQIPALNYADYDAGGNAFDCDPDLGHFPAGACPPPTLLPGQDEASIEVDDSVLGLAAEVELTGSPRYDRINQFASFSWRQLAGPEVVLSDNNARETTFRAPEVRDLLVFELTATDGDGRRYRARISLGVDVDRNDNGLIEIDSLLDLHNMRHNLAGTSYKASATSEGNSFGCPATGCEGYELMQDLDFDVDGGGTWSDNSDGGYTLDSDDSDADYFPVDEGGWEPIGDRDNPFAAIFDGNGRSIRNLAIRRNQTLVGLFGAIGGGAAIRNLGLIDNLADYTGSSDDAIYIGGLVGLQSDGSITASYATGAAAGGDGDYDSVGGLVGQQDGGSITASYATGTAAGGDGDFDNVGGLVGRQDGGSITASYAMGSAAGGGDGFSNAVGGLVGRQDGGSITASYATGTASDSGGSGVGRVGGLVGYQEDGSITASYATGAAIGGAGGTENVGGLVGYQEDGSITASYATGAAIGGAGGLDNVGGLVGLQDGSITASYATGTADGRGGLKDSAGGLVGGQGQSGGSITASYGFGEATGEIDGLAAGMDKSAAVGTAAELTVANVGPLWNNADNNTWGAWDFGAETQIPALNYADYDDGGSVFACTDFPAGVCGTLLPGQRYAVVVSVARLEVDEDGSAAYSLRLTSAPTDRVRVRVVVPLAYRDSLTAFPASLFFNDVAEGQAEHWRTDQGVTLSLVEDEISSGTRVLTIGHAISSSDPNYDGVETPSVEVALIDNDPLPSLRLVLVPATAVEGSGGTDGSDPSREERVEVTAELEGLARSVDTVVTLTVGVVGDSAGEDDYQTDLAADTTLTILAGATASAPLELVVTLFQDRIDEGDESFTIRAFADVLGAASATFVIADDDPAGVEVTLEPRKLRKGEEIIYDVVLESEPIGVVEVAVTVESVAGFEAVPTGVELELELDEGSLTFDSSDWFSPRTVTLRVAEVVTDFGELEIRHSISSSPEDPTYDALPPVSVRLELVDVDASLQALTLRLTRTGDPIPLLGANGSKGFSSEVLGYSATVPFPAASVFITATPAVTEDILINNEIVQRQAEVRIFRAEQDKGEDVAGASVEVNLPGAEDRFAFTIEVSVPPLDASADDPRVVRRNYSLTLTRALPADAELRVYLASDGERQTPTTALDFGPDDDEITLTLILGDGESSYSISEIEISGSNDSFEPPRVDKQTTTEAGGFETQVILGRADDDAAEDVSYNLTFTATPARPPADDANLPSATIAGTLKANVDTKTEIEATYLGQDQDEKRPISPADEIRVSANGTVTIQLRVVPSGGGERSFKQSDFSPTISVTPNPDPLDDLPTVFVFEDGCGCYKLEIGPRKGPLELSVEVTAEETLGARIDNPPVLAFTLSFESPRALIRPLANPDPLFAFSEPFFAFVGEENLPLPLEVVLTADSTPLADSKGILDALPLTAALADGDISATVSIADADADDDLPGRNLEFGDIKAPKNSVTVEVAVGGEGSKYVEVETRTFSAHFLSLEHNKEIEFREDEYTLVREFILKGEDPENDNWTFAVDNELDLAGNGYEVMEVVLKPKTRISAIITKTVPSGRSTPTYTVATQTVQIVDGVETEHLGEASDLDEADALSMYGEYPEFTDLAAYPAPTATIILVGETEATAYVPGPAEEDAETRSLRVTRQKGATKSRIVLKFTYLLGGTFFRIIELAAEDLPLLKAEVTPPVVVVSKGGPPQEATLVVSNLRQYDNLDEISIKFDIDRDADLTVKLLPGSGTIDRINKRFEQRLEVRAAADAELEEYFVRVEVVLPDESPAKTTFKVDINYAPQYKGTPGLSVYESGGGSKKEYLLKIVDSDGGSQFLNAASLSLQVIGFEDEGYSNDYFELEFSASEVGQEGPANGTSNSLAVTLTLTGKLATPFNSVIQLRLFGVTDGFDGFEQYLPVRVKNRPPEFKLDLAETEAIAVFLGREPATIKVTKSIGVTDVVVLKAPDDLVVKFNKGSGEDKGAITLRRLNRDPAKDAMAGSGGKVELAALDAAGGRTVVTIRVERPALLPQIVPPDPLFIPVGGMRTRQLSLEKGTDLVVTWMADKYSVPEGISGTIKIDIVRDDGDDGDGGYELSLTVATSAPVGREFNLRLTAAGGGYEWDAFLPVALVAAKAKPRLKLRATIPDPKDSDETVIVSSFTLNEMLSIGVALEGEVPSSEGPAGVTAPSFQIRIVKLDGSGEPDGGSLTFSVESRVAVNGGFDIGPVLVGGRITTLSLGEGDVVEVSINHLLNGKVSDRIIAGDSLRLRISKEPGRVDADNDGLLDSIDGDDGPGVLGPIRVPVPADGGADLGGGEVSLSLGDAARFLGLGECGGVSLTLTLSEGGATLAGCYGDIEEDSQLLATETMAVGDLELDEGGDYRLIDLSATFDSSKADPDDPLVISLPFDPRTHGIYRFDRESGEWLPVIDADLPVQQGSGLDGPRAHGDAVGETQSRFYALDFDRDGSVELLLLVAPMDPDFEFALEDASLEGRQIEISAGESLIIALGGLDEGLTVTVTVTGETGSVSGRYVPTATIGTDYVGPAVELFGLKRTNGPEEVLIEALDVMSGKAVATISLYVAVPNQLPKITFEHEKGKELSLLLLPSRERAATFILDPTEGEGVLLALAPNTETVLLVMISDADGDLSFDLELMDDDRDVAKLESNFRGLVDGEPRILHELTLSSMGIRAGRFEVTVRVTDLSDESERVATLFGCVLNGSGQCPAPARSGGGGGGGGGTGLLWLLFAAPAALCRDTRLRQRLAAVHNRQRGC